MRSKPGCALRPQATKRAGLSSARKPSLGRRSEHIDADIGQMARESGGRSRRDWLLVWRLRRGMKLQRSVVILAAAVVVIGGGAAGYFAWRQYEASQLPAGIVT